MYILSLPPIPGVEMCENKSRNHCLAKSLCQKPRSPAWQCVSHEFTHTVGCLQVHKKKYCPKNHFIFCFFKLQIYVVGLYSSFIQNLHLLREIWIWEELYCPNSGTLYSNNSSHAAPESICLWLIIEIFYCKETFFLYYFPVYLMVLYRCFICISSRAK